MPRPARTREQSGWRRARKTQASGVGRQAPGRKKWTVHSGRERSIERRAARGKQRAPDGARRRSAARHSGRAHASRLRCSMCAEAWARLHVSAGMRPAAGGKRGGQATGQAEGRAGRLSLRLPPCCTLPARQQLSVKSQARVSALRACASQRMTAGRRRVGRAGRGGGGAHRDSARASRLTGCAPVGSRSGVNQITRCPPVAAPLASPAAARRGGHCRGPVAHGTCWKRGVEGLRSCLLRGESSTWKRTAAETDADAGSLNNKRPLHVRNLHMKITTTPGPNISQLI